MSVPLHAPARELARLVATRALSPVDIVQATLDRIQEQNPALNAYVAVDADRALDAARAAEHALMHSAPIASHSLGTSHFQPGTLFGVPVSIKSSISVTGLPWETGSRFRAGIVGDADAPLVTRLKAAGAIVIGVTNVAEQLMAWETDNALYGRTNSPWALDRTPGGSSGGEAAAIAAGLSAGGIGSDGGGSIRVPAHFSGICGLKPTPGRVPATGHFPPCAGPFALTGVVGPMARTVDDVEIMLAAMAGPDIGDPNGHPVPFTPLTSVPKGTRVAVFEDDGAIPVTGETRRAIRQAADALRSAGCLVEDVRPDGLEEARELWWEIFGHAVALVLEPLVAGREGEVHPNLLEFLEWTRRGPRLTAERLLEVEINRDLLKSRVLEQMQRYPVLLCPVAPIPAFRHGERSWPVGGRDVHYLDAWRYTAWFNLLQNPAMSVPVLQSDEGLPIGVQVVAAPWNEALCLAAARIIEAARGAWVAPPTFPNLSQPLATPPNLTQPLPTPPNPTQPLVTLPNLS
jgi:Asp-tRNA(Asn)/Glu-tRNA(Gln) amidotransferase A subunit family amidase